MKNNLVLITFVGLFIFFSSCKKQKMPEGVYRFTFENTEGILMEPITLYYEVAESTRDYIILNNSYQDTLYKDGKNISGTITHHGSIIGLGHGTVFCPFHITGIYDKIKCVYSINGTFTSQIITGNPNNPNTDTTVNTAGTFEFKQFFIE